MPPTLQLPDLRRILGGLERRVGILERRINPQASEAGSNADIIFSHAGALMAYESPPVKVRYSGSISVLAVALGTAGSSNTVLQIMKNGSVAASVTVPSGSSDYVPNVGVRVNGEDRISLKIDTAGTGAANLTAMARFG
jgi:hypothetical protein